MILKNGNFKIKISEDKTFTFNSTDNKPFDVLINPLNINRSDYYKAFCIEIETDCSLKRLILVGPPFGSTKDIAIINDNNLIMYIDTTLFVIDYHEAILKFYKVILTFGTGFSIYKFCDGYIIYGELEIIKLSKNFNVEWSFSGKDIFVTDNDTNPFLIEGELIYLTDWNGDKYIIDNSGKVVG
ncbi:MAG: hypothetical protein LBH71_04140 [Oscillospiraceae bacterium]|jgi:hypothetical protein|nr:hypothetical protein [Oscillospiraceae bacterium]